MPFRRRRFTRFRRRRFGGMRGISRRRRGFGRSRGVWSAIRSINNRLTSEVKKFDVTSSDATLDIAGVVFPLSNINGADTGASGRNGDQVKAKYLSLFGSVTLSATAANAVRVIVLQDTKMVADTGPTPADVLESVSYLAQFNSIAATTGRFNIIWNKLFVNRIGAGVAEIIPIKKYFNLMKYPKIKYNASAATDVDNNGFYMIVIPQTDEAGAVDINSRLGFYDN